MCQWENMGNLQKKNPRMRSEIASRRLALGAPARLVSGGRGQERRQAHVSRGMESPGVETVKQARL